MIHPPQAPHSLGGGGGAKPPPGIPEQRSGSSARGFWPEAGGSVHLPHPRTALSVPPSWGHSVCPRSPCTSGGMWTASPGSWGWGALVSPGSRGGGGQLWCPQAAPLGSPEVPRGAPRCLGCVSVSPGGTPGSPGVPRCPQAAPQGLRTCPRVPGKCPGVPRRFPKVVRRCPRVSRR